ncbi:hypothetical protein M413DRAFT_443619 [Hebeloma cylindrosporum]|uniref:tRNA-splicing endonuclease subunit Sen15 domain-containing protein n=1 Tax=Hebeloma cylindrosporum TaxID=76867 RepID=A0A0C3C4C6_HEBCY|nr:hypothetical protein M413DRAFT_443619 [Hebeloma cylindrosporum h7]
MESHPSYPVLSALIAKYPQSSASLFQTYNDIVYAQQWNDVGLIDLQNCGRGAIKGKKRETEETLYVLPCSLSETVNFAWLQSAFSQLFPAPLPRDTSLGNETISEEVENPSLYIAITSSDASIVYYKLSQGIVKPTI